MKRIPYKPASTLPPETQTLSTLAQALIGCAIGVGTVVVVAMMGVLTAIFGIEFRGWWWIGVFVYIWMLVFISLRKRWHAMLVSAIGVTAIGIILERIVLHLIGGA